MPPDHGDEVVHVLLLLLPMKEGLVPGRTLFDKATVGEHRHALRDAADHFAGEPLVRIVVAREPMAVALRFALRPEMVVALGITHRLGAVEPALLRLGGVGDGHGGLGAGGDGLGECQGDRGFADVPVLECRRRVDRAHGEVDRVEPQLRQGLRDGGEGEGRLAGEATVGEVGVELESDVFHVDLAIARILAAVARMVGVGVEGEGSEEASLASAGFPAGVGMPFGTHRDGEETEKEQKSAHGGSVMEARGLWGGKSAAIVGKIVPA